MGNLFKDLYIVSDRYGSFSASDGEAYQLANCPGCGGTQMAVIAQDTSGLYKWLRCVNCDRAAASNFGVISPASRPLHVPAGVTGVELAAWEEVRSCLAAGSNTAAVMMCRKLLFHIAVNHGLPAKNERDKAPTFAEAIAHLESEGLITSRMRPWVDRIKDVGNEANHDIAPVISELANDVANFTQQLLILTYELDALMSLDGGNQP